MSRSASARALDAQGVPRSEIARRLGITREAVRQAIGRKQPRPGRPPDERVRVVVRIPREIYDEARAQQKRRAVPLQTLLIEAFAKEVLSASALEAFSAKRRVGVRSRAKNTKLSSR